MGDRRAKTPGGPFEKYAKTAHKGGFYGLSAG